MSSSAPPGDPRHPRRRRLTDRYRSASPTSLLSSREINVQDRSRSRQCRNYRREPLQPKLPSLTLSTGPLIFSILNELLELAKRLPLQAIESVVGLHPVAFALHRWNIGNADVNTICTL